MNSYKLTARMRKMRKWYKLTHYEQALYFELIAVCNEKNWKDVFQCSNTNLCRALNFTDKTLVKARNSLINAGLIYYQSGKRNRKEGSYSFVTSFGSEPALFTTTVPAPQVATVPAPHVATVPVPDNNKSINNKPPISPKESERSRNPLHIAFDDIKDSLLADEAWKEQTAMLSRLGTTFLAILPKQIDIFLQYIVATGEEYTIKTLSDAKRRFFWWWNNHGKKAYEEESKRNQTIIW